MKQNAVGCSISPRLVCVVPPQHAGWVGGGGGEPHFRFRATLISSLSLSLFPLPLMEQKDGAEMRGKEEEGGGGGTRKSAESSATAGAEFDNSLEIYYCTLMKYTSPPKRIS